MCLKSSFMVMLLLNVLFFICTFDRYIIIILILIIIKLYCHIQRALHDELECSLALTHIVPIYTIK